MSRAGSRVRALLWVLAYIAPAIAIDLALIDAIRSRSDGALCPALDDAFIHFQYARSFAEGHPLAYHPGDTVTTGATSLAWPLLLAIPWALGARGMAIVAAANALAVVLLALAAREAHALGDRLIGAPAGIGCAALCYAIPMASLHALSGMETALVTASVLASTAGATRWFLARGPARTPGRALGLALVGATTAAVRPECVGAAAAVAGALLLHGAPRAWWSRALAPFVVLPAAIPTWIALRTTGQGRTNGQIVKWLFADPYLDDSGRHAELWLHLEALRSDIFGIEPTHPGAPALAIVCCVSAVLLVVGVLARHRARGVLLVLAWAAGAAGILPPTTYWTFDTNWGRYLWPFVPVLALAIPIAGVAMARAVDRIARGRARRARAVLALALALAPVPYAVTGWRAALELHSDSASEICEQHVSMAASVRALPPDAIVGVGDAGAIAYLGEHRTYDIIGLTTAGAAAPYANGHGSIYEQLEAQPRERRPTHLAIYPSWFPDLAAIGDPPIARAVVEHREHVGAGVKELRPVRMELFDLGERPRAIAVRGALADEVDESLLTSEVAHDYRHDGRRRDDVVRVGASEGAEIAEGCRVIGVGGDQLTLYARPGTAARWIMRLSAPSDAILHFEWNRTPLVPVQLQASAGFVEIELEIPAELVRERNRIARWSERGPSAMCHQWLAQ